MKIFALLLLQSTVNPIADDYVKQPKPFTQAHSEAIGCVAVIALVADQQNKGAKGFSQYGDLNETGPLFAANVGEKVLKETAQTREVIAFAIQESAREQLSLLSSDRSADLSLRMETCLPLLEDSTADAIIVEKRKISADDYRDCGAIIGVMIDRDDMRIAKKDLLFENLSWRYKQEKYGRTSNGSTFARADILKEKINFKTQSFEDEKVTFCQEIGS